ncbi:metallophosphoesterase [Archangium violaceum]|uniref:metallophosphoesterase n=1 Tax=Archangium violaceum TaxID=83451 RepID=UPI00194F8915|nr:metallophosphoesterase [Archangium violaceum]QRN95909.1 metallophosphoesterase [Archangium violaceum]
MARVLMVLFPLAALGVLAASFWYVAHRLRVLFGLTRPWPVRLGVASVFVGALVAVGSAAKSDSAAVGVLNVLGGYVLTSYLFLLLALLGLHALHRKRGLPAPRSGVAAVAVALGVTGAGALWANRLSVEETEILLPGLATEVVVMHISDVHIGHHRGRGYLAKVVEEANRHKPDVVLITGDLVDSRAAFLPGELAPLSDFDAPVYYVGGNHEKDVDAVRAFELVAQQGVRVLHNEAVETHGLQVVGLDYMKPDEDTFDMHPSDDKRTIKSVLPGIPLRSDVPSVLMHHSPVGARYAAAAGIDLMVSGHTHGGQVFPFTLLAALIFPFNRGLDHQDETQVFVSQGAGTFMARVRVGTSNELNLLRLKPGNAPVRVAR